MTPMSRVLEAAREKREIALSRLVSAAHGAYVNMSSEQDRDQMLARKELGQAVTAYEALAALDAPVTPEAVEALAKWLFGVTRKVSEHPRWKWETRHESFRDDYRHLARAVLARERGEAGEGKS